MADQGKKLNVVRLTPQEGSAELPPIESGCGGGNPSERSDATDYVGTGVAFIAPHHGYPTPTCWHGYWSSDDDGPGWLADSGHHESPESAVAWARARTPTVFVRLNDSDEGYLWAGEGPAKGDRRVFTPRQAVDE